MVIEKIKRFMKKSRLIRRLYYKLMHTIVKAPNYAIPEIISLLPKTSTFNDARLNILIPSIKQEHMFGGISTALKFFERLADSMNVKRRIIVTDTPVDSKDVARFHGYLLGKENCDSDRQVMSVYDRHKALPVWKNDIFISSIWWTEYCLGPIIKWQSETYNQPAAKHIYFIQDFEPYFYPWSAMHMLALSTYKTELPVIAMFNSKSLKDYFKQNNLSFTHEFYFDPVLNRNLSNYYDANEKYNKKKQIMIYGRPGTPRNAFELIVEALKQWVCLAQNPVEWTILSLGEKHPNVNIGEGCILKSEGKLPLNEYAELMKETYAGISLMVSPHPSYPPLEMSSFGVKTITNCYANKDLTGFNDNIISLKCCTAQAIAEELVRLCNNFDGTGKPGVNGAYTGIADEFSGIISDISEILQDYSNCAFKHIIRY